MGRIEKMGLLLFLIMWPSALTYVTHQDTIPEWSFWVLALLIAMSFLGLMTFLFTDQEIQVNIQDRRQ